MALVRPAAGAQMLVFLERSSTLGKRSLVVQSTERNARQQQANRAAATWDVPTVRPANSKLDRRCGLIRLNRSLERSVQ